MGTTLTGTTPQDTYDSLIKVTDNGPLSGTLKALSDGLGNDSTLSLSTTAASIAGTLAVTGSSTFSSTTAVASTGGTSQMRIDRSGSVARMQNYDTGSAANISLQHDGGNVGIGTSSPAGKLSVDNSASFTGGSNYTTPHFFLKSNSATTAGNTTRLALGVFDGAQAYLDCISTSNDGGTADLAVLLRGGGAPSERARFTPSGLTFNGDTAAANALDDYEEGTWTMGIAFDGASVALTYSTQAGTYTKIGRQVTLNGRISLSAKGSSTGEARITGLPFTIANTEGNRSVPALRFANITFANQFQGFGVNNTTQILLQEITEAGTDSVLTNADFANNSEIFICFTYFV